MNIGVQALQSIFNQKLNDQNSQTIENSKKYDSNIIKSGLLSGIKSVNTGMINQNTKLARHSLGKNMNEMAINKLQKINEGIEDAVAPIGTVQKRNLVNPYINKSGGKSTRITPMKNYANSIKPFKPSNGKINTEMNTKWGQTALRKKLNLIRKMQLSPISPTQ